MRLIVRISLVSSVCVLPALAVVGGPYAPDANTVHLFHLDEAAPASAAANSVAGGSSALAYDGTTAANQATTAQPAVTSILGAAGLAGFGNSANVSAAGYGLGLDANNSGGFQFGVNGAASPDAVTHSTLAGADGSFTLEALVNLPAVTVVNREILCTDASTVVDRGFQFRITTSGQLNFNFISGTGTEVLMAIPTTGNHAFAANQWFHVALSYNGATHTSTFYWTRVADSQTQANAIGSSTAEITLATAAGPLVIGNEARSGGSGIGSGEGLLGLIDEVRVSKSARPAGDFLFKTIDLVTDSDNDGLPDSWEQLHFHSLEEKGDDDFDTDGFSNAAEYQAGSNPANPASTPLDTDADGLADAWERQYFGSLAQNAASDPDGDGQTNLTEQANHSAPNHRASNSTDIDADALPDAWERTHFPDLATNGGSDPDGDGFGNLQEFQAGTNPANRESRPPGTAVRLVPLDDGDNSTSDFGYAGSSAINSVAFVRSSIKTVGNQQFITWYGRHQYDPSARYNNTIWIGRRTLGSSNWEIFRHPSFTANTITDGHDVICYGIDGDGFMHVSWGMHGDAFHYSKSTAPVTGTAPITLGPDTTMTGLENTVTYPQFLKLPSGDLLFLFREVASGNGDTFVNRYSIATRTWSNVHGSTTTQSPFIKGTGWNPNYNAYLNMPQLGGADGDDLIITWCWRYEPVGNDSPGNFDGYQTNNNLNYARSSDAGLTWRRFDGTPYVLPITRDLEISATHSAEIIRAIPEGSSLINQASTCLDANDNPATCTWWAPETAAKDYRRQYMVVFRDDNGTPETTDDSWQTRAVSSRTTDPAGTRYAEDHVRDLGRPIIVSDDEDRLIIAYRDNQSTNSLNAAVDNGLTIVHCLPKADDPHRLLWIQFNLTGDNLGNYEPIIDNELWDRERQLHFLYQPAEGQGYTSPGNTASRFSVLEWNAAAYLAHEPQPKISISADQKTATISCASEPGWGYRLWSGTSLTDWEAIETRPGTGSPLEFIQPAKQGEVRRFWKIEYKEGGF